MTDVSVTLRSPCWCPSVWAPTGRLHTKLFKFGWNTFPNNARMNYRTVLNPGEVVYISIIFHIPVSWPNLLNGYDFYFWWRDTDNQPFRRFQKVNHWPHLVSFVKNAEKSTRKPKCKHRCPKLTTRSNMNNTFFSVRKRPLFNKSCNLIGSGSCRNFPTWPAAEGSVYFREGITGDRQSFTFSTLPLTIN